MPKLKFITATRSLPGAAIAEAVGTFELSAIGADASGARALLSQKLKEFFADHDIVSSLALHRRLLADSATVGRTVVRLASPPRSPAWREAAEIPVDYVQWAERDDLFVAYAPQFQITAFAPEAADLEARLAKNVQLVLLRLGKDLNLVELSRAEAVEAIHCETIEIDVKRKTAKQEEMDDEREPDKTETLKKVAEQMGGESTPAAYEMEAELALLAEALAPEARRSVLLVGPPGSGKTALVREFVRRRAEFMFGATTFWATSGSRLMTGPIGYGLWQERCQNVCRELAQTHGILHVGNLSELVEVGKTRRTEQSVGGFLRPWIARGEAQMIAEVTPEQLARIERQEPQLVAAFRQVKIPARSREQTARILEAIWLAADGERPTAAEQKETRAALARLLSLHERYGVYSAKPGRAIRFLRNILNDIFPRKNFTEADVTERFSRESGMPAALLDDRVRLDLDRTEGRFASRVVGQEAATSRVVDLIATVKARLARPGKPLASFLFIGPTGVGKTEMAKALAEYFFGSASRLARFDLNQFNDPASVQRLIGAPGTGEGLLTARVREQPFSVILLDEFEKADAAFFDLLLQMLGDGRLTDNEGRLADFSNSVVVMTSNLGAEKLQRGALGFGGGSAGDAHFEEAVAKFLRPEIFNRLDAIIPFHSLPAEVIRSIANRCVTNVRHRHGFAQREIDFQIDDSAIDHLARIGMDPKYGARPLKRAVERELIVPLADWLAENPHARGATIRALVKRGKIAIAKETATTQALTEEVPTRTATDAIDLRRAMARFKTSRAFTADDNQLTLLRHLEARLNKAKWKSPEDLRRLERLPELNRVVDAVLELEEKARALETEILSAIYQKGDAAANWSASVSKLRGQRRDLQFEIFEASMENSDRIVFAIFCEDKSLLTELLQTYRKLAGEVTEVHVFLPATRAKGTKAALFGREAVEDLKKFFAAPPAAMLGLAMGFSGKLHAPKFAPEAGLHKVEQQNKTQFALVETFAGPIADYHPPQGFGLQGFIHAKTAPLRRALKKDEGRVIDSVLGDVPWVGPGLERSLARALEEALEKTVLEATGGE